MGQKLNMGKYSLHTICTGVYKFLKANSKEYKKKQDDIPILLLISPFYRLLPQSENVTGNRNPDMTVNKEWEK